MPTAIKTVAVKVQNEFVVAPGAASKPASVKPCKLCSGVGWLRQDVPFGHPDFGKAFPCECQTERLQKEKFSRAFRMCQLSGLRSMTFETFQPRGRPGIPPDEAQSIQHGFTDAQDYAMQPNGWLFVAGPCGCGKTHLAASIANHICDNRLSDVLFITVPDMLDNLRATFNERDNPFYEIFEEIKNIPILILDDFGIEFITTPWAQEKMFQLINHRYINRLALVITTNNPKNEIKSKAQRLYSRITDIELTKRVIIEAGDYRNLDKLKKVA